MYLQNFKCNEQRVCIFHLILDGVFGQGCGVGFAYWTKSVKRDKSYLTTIPKKSAFFKSLIVMKCSKYLIFIVVKHWILNCHTKLDWKRGGKKYHPFLGNGESANLSFCLNHCYTHVSKQILEYIFPLNKYMQSWDTVLINQLTTAILQQ